MDNKNSERTIKIITENSTYGLKTDHNFGINEIFINAFNAISKGIHKTAVEKGWWDSERNDGEAIALMHSELSEALESLRAGAPADDKVPEFSGVEAELADVIIRIMDIAERRKWKVAEALIAKSEFNKSRENKHGGKKF